MENNQELQFLQDLEEIEKNRPTALILHGEPGEEEILYNLAINHPNLAAIYGDIITEETFQEIANKYQPVIALGLWRTGLEKLIKNGKN